MPLDALYVWAYISKLNAWIKVKPTLVEPQSPSGYGKVPFATYGPPNSTNTGDIHKNNYKNIILEIQEDSSTTARDKLIWKKTCKQSFC